MYNNLKLTKFYILLEFSKENFLSCSRLYIFVSWFALCSVKTFLKPQAMQLKINVRYNALANSFRLIVVKIRKCILFAT